MQDLANPQKLWPQQDWGDSKWSFSVEEGPLVVQCQELPGIHCGWPHHTYCWVACGFENWPLWASSRRSTALSGSILCQVFGTQGFWGQPFDWILWWPITSSSFQCEYFTPGVVVMSFNSLLDVILHSISLAVKTAVPCMDFWNFLL